MLPFRGVGCSVEGLLLQTQQRLGSGLTVFPSCLHWDLFLP